MKKVRIAQATLVFGIAGGLLLALPGFLRHAGDNSRDGLILVNGRIEGTEVAVGSKLPGRVSAVYVTEAQAVKAGTLIAELEADDVQAACDQAQANVLQAKHTLENAKEDVIRSGAQLEKARIALQLTETQTGLGIIQSQAAVEEAQSAVKQAQALLSRTRTEYENARELREKDAASKLELAYAKDALEAQEAAVQMAQHRLEQAQQGRLLADARKSEIQICRHELTVVESTLRQAQTTVGIAQAQLDAAQATLRIFEIKLKDTKIVSPCDGVVVTRAVEPGEIVNAGATLAVVVDFDRLFLKAFLPSKLISLVKLNGPVRVYFDAFPDRFFEATVTQVNQQSEFTPKSVDTPQQRVKLVFGLELTITDNRERLIKPGMPADAVIKTDPKSEWPTSSSDLR